MGAKLVGARVRRLEDPRLLRGQAQFVDDIKLPGLVHMAILRSPYPHAIVKRIDCESAKAAPGVVDAFTAAAFGENPPSIPALLRHEAQKPCPQFFLALDRVRYVGEGLAVVVANSRAAAEDALELIEVDYEQLEAVTDAEKPGPDLHDGVAGNVCAQWVQTVGDVTSAFSEADLVVHERLVMQRYSGIPVETRGVVALPDPLSGELTIWDSTQWPHTVRLLVAAMLQLPERAVRVIMPDIGGGFGVKVDFYPEDLLVPFAAKRLSRPVKWIEDRREHMLAAVHARQQVNYIELALRRDGTMLAMRDRVITDMGAYIRTLGIVGPSLGAATLPGAYKIPNLQVESVCVLTNKSPASVYRGAGQPESTYARERIVDIAAVRLGMDPAELRRRNLIRSEDTPYTTGLSSVEGAVVLDSGDYPAALENALEAIGYAGLREAQRKPRSDGRRTGLGIAVYPQISGGAVFEGAGIRVDGSGKVTVATGVAPQGQGTLTTLGQIVADELGVQLEDIVMQFGDTARIPYGTGTFASRNVVMGGTAVQQAAIAVRNKAEDLAAHLLEVDVKDIQYENGAAHVRGVPSNELTLAALAQAAAPGGSRPDGMEPGLEAVRYFETNNTPYSYAVHVALAEVDPDTGVIDVTKYAVCSDTGRMINPTLVEGQIIGGVAQGLGGALLEELTYDESGQMTAASFLDYLMPSSLDVPDIIISHIETLTTLNPLGVKGMGEGGAIGAHAAVANAVADALGSTGSEVTKTPLTPAAIWALVSSKGGQS